MKEEVITVKKNVGKNDTYIRYAVGLVFLVLAIVWSWWFVIPAVISIVTGYLGFCGLYSLFGINTCKLKDE